MTKCFDGHFHPNASTCCVIQSFSAVPISAKNFVFLAKHVLQTDLHKTLPETYKNQLFGCDKYQTCICNKIPKSPLSDPNRRHITTCVKSNILNKIALQLSHSFEA